MSGKRYQRCADAITVLTLLAVAAIWTVLTIDPGDPHHLGIGPRVFVACIASVMAMWIGGLFLEDLDRQTRRRFTGS